MQEGDKVVTICQVEGYYLHIACGREVAITLPKGKEGMVVSFDADMPTMVRVDFKTRKLIWVRQDKLAKA